MDFKITPQSKNVDLMYGKANRQTNTAPSCSGPIPTQKSQMNSLPGAIFFQLMLEMDFNYFHHFSVFFPNKDDGNDKSSFMALGGKIQSLVLNSSVTFVSGSVRCSSALCLFAFLSPCMDVMVSFYNGIERHIIYASFATFLLTF